MIVTNDYLLRSALKEIQDTILSYKNHLKTFRFHLPTKLIKNQHFTQKWDSLLRSFFFRHFADMSRVVSHNAVVIRCSKRTDIN